MALSNFESSSDLHILHPYSALPGPIHYNDEEKIRKAVRFVHENEVAVELAKTVHSRLPGLYRVGIRFGNDGHASGRMEWIDRKSVV